MIECKYCGTNFESIKQLNRHIKHTKYCILIQQNLENEYNDNLKISQLQQENLELKTTNANIRNENSELQLKIIQLQQENSNLFSKLYTTEKYTKSLLDITKASAVKSTYTTNYIQNNITTKRIKDALPTLTIDVAKNGPEGYCKWAYENFLYDSVTCADMSRKKILWKDSNDNVIQDYQGINLCKKIFKAISQKNYKMIQKYVNKTKNYIENCDDIYEKNIMYELILKLESIRIECIDVSQGTINKFMNKFMRHLTTIIQKISQYDSDSENNNIDCNILGL